MVSHCVDSIIQEQFAGDEKYDEVTEEYLLGPLDPNVPVEYATVDSGLYDDEMPPPPETAATDVAIPSLEQYPQLGLNYDPEDEAIFHLPEDEYEQIPLEAFETDEEEVQEDNPFRAVGYDDEVDDLLSSTEGCPVCSGRKRGCVLSNCGHLLCGYCTTKSYNLSRLDSRCPICHSPILVTPMRILL